MIFALELCFDLDASLIFSVLYGTNKILRAIINFNFFQSFEGSGGRFISFQLYLITKGLRLDVLSGLLLICLWLNAAIKHIESNYHHCYFQDLLLLFYFLPIQENLYIILLFLDLFFEDNNNTINQYDKK